MPTCSLTGSEVVHVSSQQDGDSEEASNGNRSRLRLFGGRCSDDTILSDDLDTLDVRAGSFVGVVDVHLALALSGNLVNVTAELTDSVVVVSVVASTSSAGHGNHGFLGVRKSLDGVLRLREASARVVSEQAEADLSSLVGTVRPDVVGDIAITVVSVSVSISVLGKVTAHVELRASHVAAHVITVAVVVIIVVVVTLRGRVVGAQVGLHVHDVVSVARGAAAEIAAALTGGAESEANQTLGHDADIVFVRSIVIPLLDVVASLELNAVAREKAGVHVVIVVIVLSVVVAVLSVVVVVVVIVKLTGVVHQVASTLRVHGNISVLWGDNIALGDGQETQSKDGDTREHGGSYFGMKSTVATFKLKYDRSRDLACRRRNGLVSLGSRQRRLVSNSARPGFASYHSNV